MTTSPKDTDDLSRLFGVAIPSEVAADTFYKLSSVAGVGAMSVAFYGQRISPEGRCPVVVKVLRPELVRYQGETAKLLVLKEAVALGRLNERIPATPHVVRLIDTGEASIDLGGMREIVPWIALEYVHGGAQGTTLSQRVLHAIRSSGHAFDPARAALLVEALGAGLGAVHEVGVIHRDIKPENVLCCGFGDEEIFKIADFGVARPSGIGATFNLVVGTMGYAAPELTMGGSAVGPWSDVFSMAAVVFFVLTGQDYFDVSTPEKAILGLTGTARRSIGESPWLAPELRRNAEACRAIDFALACASSPNVDVRPHRADALAVIISPWLRSLDMRPSAIAARRAHLEDETEVTRVVQWNWLTLRQPGALAPAGSPGRRVREVAWDGDGRCMAATTDGLAFWDGATWRDVPVAASLDRGDIAFVRRAGPGQWLVGDGQLSFALYTPAGPSEAVHHPAGGLRFQHLAGRLDQTAVLVGSREGAGPTLACRTGGRWREPVDLAEAASISGLTRIAEARWLLTGCGGNGAAYAATVSPLDGELRRLATPGVAALLACAGRPARGIGLAVGAAGSVVWVRPQGALHETVPGGHELTAAAFDAADRGLCAGAGHIWIHRRRAATLDAEHPEGHWEGLWSDPTWRSPFISLFTEPGLIVAMTADGGIVEGRAGS